MSLPKGSMFWVHAQKVWPRQRLKVQDVDEPRGIIAVFPSDDRDVEAFETRTQEGHSLWVVRRFLDADAEARTVPHLHWPARRSKFSLRSVTDRVSIENLEMSSPEKLAEDRAVRERLAGESEGLESLPRDLTAAMEQEELEEGPVANFGSRSGSSPSSFLPPAAGEPSMADLMSTVLGLKDDMRRELQSSQDQIVQRLEPQVQALQTRVSSFESRAEPLSVSAAQNEAERYLRKQGRPVGLSVGPRGYAPSREEGRSSMPAFTTARSREAERGGNAQGVLEGPPGHDTPLRVDARSEIFQMTSDSRVPPVLATGLFGVPKGRESERRMQDLSGVNHVGDAARSEVVEMVAAAATLMSRRSRHRSERAARRRGSSGSSDESSDGSGSHALKDMEGLRALARRRRRIPRRWIRRWTELVELDLLEKKIKLQARWKAAGQ